MSSSPYLSQDLKNYLQKYNLQALINTTVNALAREMPEDPYSFLIKSFEKYASQQIKIVGFTGIQTISSEGIPVITVNVTVDYLSKRMNFNINTIFGIANDNNALYIYDEGSKGHNKGIQFLKKLSEVVSGKFCSAQKQIDTALLAAYQKNQKKGLYQLNIASYLPSLVAAHVLSKPYYKIIKTIQNPDNQQNQKKFNIIINCLQGSKLVGSKCKVFKYLLIGQNIKEVNSITAVIQAIKKTITSGKGGQAALKYHPDGTFLCPADTIIDNLKIVEQAINSTGNKDKFTIGISWMADNFYIPEQKKYQLQNPKALFDADQLIEYYAKLVADKPLISYLQDPIYSQDTVAWTKILNKFKDSKIRIGSRKLYNSIENIKKLSYPVSKQTNPQLQDNVITDLNSKRINLNFHNYRLFELETLSKVLELKKALKTPKTTLILSDNMIQTHDTSIIDICVGLGGYINLGAPIKFDRLNKLNRLNELILNS